MDFGIDCDLEDAWNIEDMLLPGAKALWEARDEETWRRTRTGRSSDTLLSMLRLRDLMNLDSSSSRQALVAIWQEDLDEFGILLTLASQMM